MLEPMVLCSECSILRLQKLQSQLLHCSFFRRRHPYKLTPLLPCCRTLEKAEFCLQSPQLHACWDGSWVIQGHHRCWYPWQMLVPTTGQACSMQLLSAHQQVKHLCRTLLLKMHYRRKINAFPFEYCKCILLLWVAPLRL